METRPSSPLRVLIVDDDPTVVLALHGALRNIAQVAFTINSEEVLGLVRDQPPDVVLLDLSMPGYSGYDVFQQLAANPSTQQTAVIFITSLDSPQEQQRCFEMGGADFISKPFDPIVVRARVGAQLTIRQKAREAEQAWRQLQEEKERLRVTLESIGDAVIVTDLDGYVTYTNPVAEAMTGYPSKDAIGLSIERVMPLRTSTTGIPQTNPIRIALDQRRTVGMALDAEMQSRDGRWVYVEDSAAPIRDADHTIIGAVIVFHDVSETRAMTIKMTHMAHHDQLTNLPNRMQMVKLSNQFLGIGRLMHLKVALLIINLDQFKYFNNALGYAAGDYALKTLTERFNSLLKHGEVLTRSAGDEFVLIAPAIEQAEQVGDLASQLLKAAREPILIQGEQQNLSVSIGVSVYPDDAEDTETLLRHADAARYRAKIEGRNCVRFFSQDMESLLRERHSTLSTIRWALENHAVVVHYQPKMNVATHQLDSVEALMRLHDAEGRLIAPNSFIAVAEETGLIVPLGNEILRQACLQTRQWRDSGHPVKIGVNVSAIQFHEPHFCESFKEIIHAAQAHPEDIELEITESLLIEDFHVVCEKLHTMREFGCSIALDDFGTGYSSLSYLKSLPIDVLKIDRAFVQQMHNSAEDMALVETIVSLACNFKLGLVAEGIETKEQGETLQRLGCNVLQGYLYARPLPAEEVARFF